MKPLILSALGLLILVGCSNKPAPTPPPNPAAELKQAMDKAKAVEGVILDKAEADRARIDGVDR